ncbi:hypothetical protein [Flavobacterium columnare]|nr:hypothetical protein [Flavobacterium columnare]MBF6655716.1 hypothetical protein [Flavobacterium columnare]MBF6659266.1 hypothetical protein [Flavobacterium columnare]PTD14014.1 hypothetical protein C6N29_05940 [Flavobacterium columnare]
MRKIIITSLGFFIFSCKEDIKKTDSEKEIKIFKEYFNNNGLKSDYDFSAITNYNLGIDNSQVSETGYT